MIIQLLLQFLSIFKEDHYLIETGSKPLKFLRLRALYLLLYSAFTSTA